jgi:hypothetical protein
MALNFFRENCDRSASYCNTIAVKPCKSSTRSQRFGIIDNLSEQTEPAYIQEYRNEEWDVTVFKQTASNYEVIFKAIDNCLEFPEPENADEENNRCDGMLVFNDHLIFVEIKYRSGREYTEKAIKQLSRTILMFQQSHGLDVFQIRKAYVSNSAKPKAPVITETTREKFKDNNFGFELLRTTTIAIP